MNSVSRFNGALTLASGSSATLTALAENALARSSFNHADQSTQNNMSISKEMLLKEVHSLASRPVNALSTHSEASMLELLDRVRKVTTRYTRLCYGLT